MEKQTIIRGAAIIVAGIAASTFGAQHLMSGKSDRPAVAQSALADSDKTVVGAGFIGSPAAPEPDAAATLVVDDTSFVALSDAPSLVEQQSAAPELRTDMLQGDHAEHAALQDACMSSSNLPPRSCARICYRVIMQSMLPCRMPAPRILWCGQELTH